MVMISGLNEKASPHQPSSIGRPFSSAARASASSIMACRARDVAAHRHDIEPGRDIARLFGGCG
jgi:hypothetical protein